MKRVCPIRDAICPHGMNCPYVDGYNCTDPALKLMTATDKATLRPLDAKAEAMALAERAGIDMLDDHDQFIADLTETLVRFRDAALPVPAGAVTDEMVKAAWTVFHKHPRRTDETMRAALEAALATLALPVPAGAVKDADLRELLRMIDKVQGRPSYGNAFGIYNPESPMGLLVEKIRADLAASRPTEEVLPTMEEARAKIADVVRRNPEDFAEAYQHPAPSPAGDEVQGMVRELEQRAYDKTGGSALTIAYYDQFDAGLDRKAAALLAQLSKQNAALKAELAEQEKNWDSDNRVTAKRISELEARANACESTYTAWRSRALLAEAEVERCHERLEINHILRRPKGAEIADDLIREEVPMSERATMIDGIDCRDETIKLQNERISELEREIVALTAINANHCRTVNTLLVDNSRQEDRRKEAEASAEASRAMLAEAAEELAKIIERADQGGRRVETAMDALDAIERFARELLTKLKGVSS